MQPLPHRYHVCAIGHPEGTIRLDAADLPTLLSAPPKEFDGPGDQWSPEEFFLAAVGDCFVLTFRAIARASKLPFRQLDASVEGLLERVDGTTRFTRIAIQANLELGEPAASESAARRALEKAEKNCLVSNSLAVPVKLEIALSGAA